MSVCEDLATKAELQELRDQLNAVLGDKEGGGQAQVFTAGGGILATIAAIATTKLGFAKEAAPKAITQITMTKGVANGFAFGLPEGKAVLEALKADGQKVPQQALNEIGEQIGKTKAVGQVGTKFAGTSAGAVMVLGNLASIGTNLALNKATVDIFDARVNAEVAGVQQALNQQNSTMLRLYDKHEGDLEAVNTEIDNQNAIIANTQQVMDIARSDILQLSSQASTLSSQMAEANQTIQQLKADNVELVNQVNGLEVELAENHQQYLTAIAQIETQLDTALETITKMQLDAQKQNERIALLEATVLDQQAMLEEYGIDIANLQANVADLQDDIQILQEENEFDEQLVEIRSRLASSKLIIEQYRTEQNRLRGGGASAAIGAASATQTGVLQLADKLATPDPNTTPVPTNVTREDLLNNPNSFRDRFEELLDRITPDAMTPEQMQEMRDNHKTDLNDGINLAIASLLIPNLVDLKDRTSEESISRGVQAGICRSLNGGSCSSTPGNPNPTQGLQGMQNNLEAKLQGLDLAASLETLRRVTKIDDTVHHATWGLEKIQKFADAAWKATHADKVLNALSVVIALHNAAMLARNLGETLGGLTSQALATIGIKDSGGSPLDINAAIGNSVNSMLTNILGADVYQGVKETWNKSSRILSSASQIVWTVRSIADSTREITEWTAENTGKIGNALKRWRVVGENAYGWMPERMTATNKWLARVERTRNGIDSLDDAASSFSSVLGEAQNIQQEWSELDEQGTKFQDNVKALEPKEREQNEPVQLARIEEIAVSKSPASQADVFRGEGEAD
jgi:hypothetical protein